MKTDSTTEIAVVTSAMSRTASGRCRARNMISTAPTNGDHVIIERTGNGIMAVRAEARRAARRAREFEMSSHPPLGQDEQHEGAEGDARSEEHTSELQSQSNLVCRLLLEKKKKKKKKEK